MKIDILTIFPEMFTGIFSSSILKRAIENECVKIEVHDFRSYSLNKHGKVDDTSYGGGAGMLLMVQPIIDCLKSIPNYQTAHKIITSPCGKVYHQQKAKELSQEKHIIFLCGHYEGFDERILHYVDEEVSIGDYILTGGEIATLAMVDSIVRLLPNVIAQESIEEESFTEPLLEYPQYTKPAIYDGLKVPEVLVQGNHEEIRKYRRFESLKRTFERRKDLLEQLILSKEDEFFLSYIKKGIKQYEEIPKK